MCDSATTGCFFSSKKENGRSVPDLTTASPGRAGPPGPMPNNQNAGGMQQRQGVKEPVLLQGDFRKVSGISSEIFRQIEAVENDHDPSTAAALEAVERRGEMIVRILEPRCIGGRHAVEAAQKLLSKGDARHIVQLVEIVKRPGQTLGLYIREGNGADRSDGVFISRIALESAVYNSGCLRVGDEILAVNLVDVTHMSLDDVVIIMSIPRRLVLAIRQRRGGRGNSSPGPSLSRPEQKPPPVVVIKRDLRDEDIDDMDRVSRSRSSRERRTGDGREMTESRSRLGLGLNNYSPQSEQLDLYYNNRPNTINEPPSWGYKPPPPPSVITEQPKSHSFAPSQAYYQNAGTLESLAEKVHSFYPGGPGRRMSAGTGVTSSQSHIRFPRSGSDQHLPRVEYSDFQSLGRNSLLRSSLKTGTVTGGGTLGRYGRYDPPQSSRTPKYGAPMGNASILSRRSRPVDYSSDTEATIGPRPSYYYYNRPTINSIPRGGSSALGGGPDMAKFNSLPRDRPGARLGIRTRLGDRLTDDNDGNLSAPELPARRERDLRGRISASPSIFTSDEYRAWLRRAPSSSAICEQMRASRDILNQQRAHRFSCSAENIHDALKNTESIYSSRTGGLTSTLDRHFTGTRGISVPVRSLSTQHIGGASSLRSPSVRRMRQLLELTAGPASPSSGMSGHQSPAPTPSTTLPRPNRQIDINPAEFVKYKLDKPVIDLEGISGMIWIHLVAGRGLRSAPEGTQTVQGSVRDLYCVLECDRVHKARTVVRSGDLQFDWDESFELDLVSNKQLDVLVYSWDPQHRHKLCYRGAVSLSTVLRQSPIHQLALKVEPRGTIYLRLRHTDPITLYRRRGLPSLKAGYPQLFGADLDGVVTRESKIYPGQAPVPIVLRRCVEEIERRGLDIIGLYRLCGSATKKRLLREAFERNCRAVELSPDHVPDINVITGVLKDYLRELPEPLFTRCLFQMTVDALGVCLPDDPEGNAKLMLSILDCLPRANRATLVFLLDHLSLVVSASERNKMSAQALATVMGPPLMLHSAVAPGKEVDHAQPIAVLKYLLQIWPQPQQASSGRRAEPAGQRGNKVNASPVAKYQPNLHTTGSAAILSTVRHPSAIPNTHQYQSAVVQSVPLPRAMPQAVQQVKPHQLVASADSAVRALSPLPGTPSPGSSSTSTNSGSGSGTDTIKRGASPAMSITSTSTARFKESNSSYSIKQQEHQYKDGKETSTIERQKSSNSTYGPISSTILPSRSVLFSTDLVSSSSAYSIKDQTKPNPPNSTSNMPTSAAIKQTLSPLTQHRNTSSSGMHATTSSAEPNYSLKNQITSSPSLGTYQFPSSSINLKNNATSSLTEHNTSSLSPSSLRKTSSPSRTLSNNNTLPSSVVRNYQSESSYTLKNHQPQQQQQPMNFTSPGNNTNSSALNHYQSNNTNIYGTLPKTQFAGGTNNHHSMHNNSLLGSATGNEIELINRHSSGSTVTTSNGGYNTLGSYKVQYSSTNPFLQGFNPQFTDSTSTGDKANEE
ncbi:rho GTPase-activating protein 100F isoform X3 [Bradysia coprophila]|uniref:rho GTPase-activating protein 100F isoform X3 n=1 Tax=Bradysia coprophila TaxID=38358 RepID=UPI00187D7AFA|nr:rho GTPase-activating protein 100F isoform X3 [Bradysia coprophila]